MHQKDGEQNHPFKMSLASVQNGALYNRASVVQSDKQRESEDGQKQPECELAFISGHSDATNNDLTSIQFNFYCPK